MTPTLPGLHANLKSHLCCMRETADEDHSGKSDPHTTLYWVYRILTALDYVANIIEAAPSPAPVIARASEPRVIGTVVGAPKTFGNPLPSDTGGGAIKKDLPDGWRWFRKKPIEISAIQFDGKNHDACIVRGSKIAPYREYLSIPTLEGSMKADVGDWIVCGVKGEFYPVKPDIFSATYEVPVPDLPTSKATGGGAPFKVGQRVRCVDLQNVEHLLASACAYTVGVIKPIHDRWFVGLDGLPVGIEFDSSRFVSAEPTTSGVRWFTSTADGASGNVYGSDESIWRYGKKLNHLGYTKSAIAELVERKIFIEVADSAGTPLPSAAQGEPMSNVEYSEYLGTHEGGRAHDEQSPPPDTEAERLIHETLLYAGNERREKAADALRTYIATLRDERDRANEELKKWKPMTTEEAEAEMAAIEASPMPDEEVERVFAKIAAQINDPTYRPTEPEHVLMLREIRRKGKQLDAALAEVARLKEQLTPPAVAAGEKGAIISKGHRETTEKVLEWCVPKDKWAHYRNGVIAMIAEGCPDQTAELTRLRERCGKLVEALEKIKRGKPIEANMEWFRETAKAALAQEGK